MIVPGIPSSSFSDPHIPSIGNRRLDLRHGIQKLGQDVQAGDLSGAQTDFAAIQDLQSQTVLKPGTQSNNPVSQLFNQLGSDLQSGNATAAKQELSTLQHEFTSPPVYRFPHHGQSSVNVINQLLSQLGQVLHPGSVAQAQQAYALPGQALGGGSSLFAPLASRDEQAGVSLSA